MVNYRQVFAINSENENRILKVANIENKSGIYLFYRKNEDKYCCYVGQSQTSVLSRCASHLVGYKSKNASHIDKSLKSHGLYSVDNLQGWKVKVLEYCKPSECNRLEQYYIDYYRNRTDVILYNITIGSQGKGKVDFNQRNLSKVKSFKNGKNQGKNAVLKEIKVYFDKYLDFTIKGNTTKTKERKLEEFKKLLESVEL